MSQLYIRQDAVLHRQAELTLKALLAAIQVVVLTNDRCMCVSVLPPWSMTGCVQEHLTGDRTSQKGVCFTLPTNAPVLSHAFP